MDGVSKRFSNKVTRFSFLMAIFVIYIHANNLAYYGISPDQLCIPTIVVEIGGVLGGTAVPFFFMMSAYWLFRFDVFCDNAKEKLMFKLMRKVKTILVPYLLWNIFGMLFYMLITRIPFAANMMNHGESIDITIPNIVGGIFLHKYYFTFWYLQDLIFLMLISPILLWILRDRRKITILITIIFAVNLFHIDFLIFKGTSLFYFIIGAYIAVYKRDFFESKSNNALVYLVLYIGTGILRCFDLPVISQISLLATPILAWKGIDAIVVEEVYDKKVSWFETQSFFVYAVHVIPVTVVGHILAKMESGLVWATISYLIAPWLTLGGIYVIALITHKRMPRFYNVICGERG